MFVALAEHNTLGLEFAFVPELHWHCFNECMYIQGQMQLHAVTGKHKKEAAVNLIHRGWSCSYLCLQDREWDELVER